MVTGSIFTENSATAGDGGGLAVHANADSFTITDSLFEINLSINDGGGMSTYGLVALTNVSFDSNTAHGVGGALRLVGSCDKCKFTGNTAAQTGGAVYSGGSATITDSEFRDNILYASHDARGAGVYSTTDTTIENSRFGGFGLGEDPSTRIVHHDSPAAPLVIKATHFEDNEMAAVSADYPETIWLRNCVGLEPSDISDASILGLCGSDAIGDFCFVDQRVECVDLAAGTGFTVRAGVWNDDTTESQPFTLNLPHPTTRAVLLLSGRDPTRPRPRVRLQRPDCRSAEVVRDASRQTRRRKHYTGHCERRRIRRAVIVAPELG